MLASLSLDSYCYINSHLGPCLNTELNFNHLTLALAHINEWADFSAYD
jgi:hypothetical protein